MDRIKTMFPDVKQTLVNFEKLCWTLTCKKLTNQFEGKWVTCAWITNTNNKSVAGSYFKDRTDSDINYVFDKNVYNSGLYGLFVSILIQLGPTI